jgi:hypothetical protein
VSNIVSTIPVDVQLRVQALADELDRVQQGTQTLERVVLALERNEHGIGGGEPIEGEEAEGRRAVDQDEVELIPDRRQRLRQTELPPLGRHQLDLGAHQVAVGWNEIEGVDLSRDLRLRGRAFAEDEIVGGGAFGVAQAEAARRVALRVEVDQQAPVCPAAPGWWRDSRRWSSFRPRLSGSPHR